MERRQQRCQYPFALLAPHLMCGPFVLPAAGSETIVESPRSFEEIIPARKSREPSVFPLESYLLASQSDMWAPDSLRGFPLATL